MAKRHTRRAEKGKTKINTTNRSSPKVKVGKIVFERMGLTEVKPRTIGRSKNRAFCNKRLPGKIQENLHDGERRRD